MKAPDHVSTADAAAQSAIRNPQSAIDQRPRIAFVIHRCAAEPLGGLERLCLLAARQMNKYWDIDILTTCARDFTTWKNELAAGKDLVDGLSVRRFPVDNERDPQSFKELSDRVLLEVHKDEEERNWMQAQGPYSTALFEWLNEHREAYDAFFFFGYLYATTYFGISLVRDKAVLIPAAHDEPMIRLRIYSSVFASARYTLWLTPEERKLVKHVTGMNVPGEICGSGPGPLPVDRFTGADVVKPYLVYAGRVDHPKGCGELLHFFVHSAQQWPGLHLYLIGQQMMEIPEDARIHYVGWLGDRQKNWLLAHALALVMPSPYESLSLVLLESWHFAVPVLANGRCEVLKGQCVRSGGGLTYRNHLEFIEGGNRLLRWPGYRAILGLRGMRYAQKIYRWPKIEESYLRALQIVKSQ